MDTYLRAINNDKYICKQNQLYSHNNKLKKKHEFNMNSLKDHEKQCKT